MVGGTARRAAILAVVAAVGIFTVEPDQPCAADLLDAGDFAAGDAGGGAGVGGRAVGGIQRGNGVSIFPNFHVQCLFQRRTVPGHIGEQGGKIVVAFDINAGHSGRGFRVGLLQKTRGIFCRSEVISQQRHIFRQSEIGRTVVAGVFHLCEDGNDGIIFAVLQTSGQRKIVRIENLRINGDIHVIINLKRQGVHFTHNKFLQKIRCTSFSEIHLEYNKVMNQMS
ncbi:MAG: hypothetical protein SPK62_02375 [Gemmiger sp.]|nr:hypothetical protein [Gemmiger sp.]MDY5782740.1 hypothetical protein [Gemmiger sp.]